MEPSSCGNALRSCEYPHQTAAATSAASRTIRRISARTGVRHHARRARGTVCSRIGAEVAIGSERARSRLDSGDLIREWYYRNRPLTWTYQSCILMCMRTTIIIDPGLLERARQLTGIQEKTALVRAGLQALIAQQSARRLAALGGTEPALRPVPRRRVGLTR